MRQPATPHKAPLPLFTTAVTFGAMSARCWPAGPLRVCNRQKASPVFGCSLHAKKRFLPALHRWPPASARLQRYSIKSPALPAPPLSRRTLASTLVQFPRDIGSEVDSRHANMFCRLSISTRAAGPHVANTEFQAALSSGGAVDPKSYSVNEPIEINVQSTLSTVTRLGPTHNMSSNRLLRGTAGILSMPDKFESGARFVKTFQVEKVKYHFGCLTLPKIHFHAKSTQKRSERKSFNCK